MLTTWKPYGHDFARLARAFVEFTQRLPFYGNAILYVDDAAVRRSRPSSASR